MTLFALAYIGGVLTILSPCILPVLPFVFARADRPFATSGLPLLGGMAATFAVVATLAAVAGGWAVKANEYGRIAALAIVALFGVTLLFPAVAERVMRPLVAAGARLSQSADNRSASGGSQVGSSLLLGVGTGLLWAPCAGPILGVILTGAALRGANVQTSFLLLAYAAGAATSLAAALLVGGRVLAAMRRSLSGGEWVRRALGVAVLGAVVAIALGADTGVLRNLSLATTGPVEQVLVNRLRPGGPAMTAGPPTVMGTSAPGAGPTLPTEGVFPTIAGATQWLNSPPLSVESLKGKVVLIDFWTYSCINCLRAIPYVRAWAEKYKDQGLVVIGVHSPEFAFERNVANVKKAAADLHVDYPIAIDNDYNIWRAFSNEYWPAHYFIDAEGRIRHHHFGEGDYDGSEQVIQELLAEAGKTNVATGMVTVTATGAEAPAGPGGSRSPETYVGYARAEHFVSAGGFVQDAPHVYVMGTPSLNEWGLSGSWTVAKESAALDAANGSIVFRFDARDLHLVLGPGPDGKPVRFRVTIDGAVPGPDHGADIDASGNGTVTAERLYQLVRLSGVPADHTFEIRFLDPGVRAYAFTFG